MERPFREVISSARENLDKAEANDKYNQEFLDAFSLWLIGLSVGGLTLVISNTDKIAVLCGADSVKLIVLFFALSIIGSIIHRYFLFLFRAEYNGNMFYLRGALSDKKMMNIEPEDVADIQSLDKIIFYLHEDFGLDYQEYLKLQLTDEEKQIILKELKVKYTEFGKWAVEDYRLGMVYLTEVFNNAYGFSKKQFQKMGVVDGGKIRSLNKIQSYSLIFSIITFICSLLVIIFKFYF